MIYSNFTTPLVAKTVYSKQSGFYGEITLGGESSNSRSFTIECPVGLIIERGMNPFLNFVEKLYNTSPHDNLYIREYELDWPESEDPTWNIPNQLFLMLTSNFTPECPEMAKYGSGSLSYANDFTYSAYKFKKRGHCAVGGKYERKGFWHCGVFEVMTTKPSLIRILPAGHQKTSRFEREACRYLVTRNNTVTECTYFDLLEDPTAFGLEFNSTEFQKLLWSGL